jgi:hypothetical protein
MFNREELSALSVAHKLEDHPLSTVNDYLVSVFAVTLHPQPEDAPCRGDRDPHNMENAHCGRVSWFRPLAKCI